jgi:hypothetical protein
METLRSIVERGLTQMGIRGVGGKRNRGFGRLHVLPSVQQEQVDFLPMEREQRMRQKTVFISYSRSDSGFVRRLASALEAEGIAVWLDEVRLSVGDVIEREVQKGISEAVYFLVVLSEAALNSSWVQAELSTALILEERHEVKGILPIVLDSFAAENLPLRLSGRVYADARRGFPRMLFELVRRVRQDK